MLRFCKLNNRVIRLFSSAAPKPAAPTLAEKKTTNKKKPSNNNEKKRHESTLKIETQNINSAFEVVKTHAWGGFDETVEAIVMLDVDPRKPNQSIKGVASLPHGVGKKVVVAVFAKDADAQAAKDVAGPVLLELGYEKSLDW